MLKQDYELTRDEIQLLSSRDALNAIQTLPTSKR